MSELIIVQRIQSAINDSLPDNVTSHGCEVERTTTGDIYQFRYTGTKDTIAKMIDEHYMDETSQFGRLKNVRMYQEDGPIWVAEFRFEAGEEWKSTQPPSNDYGVKSCTLGCSTLSNELETQPQYKVCWNHFLWAAPGTSSVPGWWSTATDPAMTESDGAKYAWTETLGGCPVTKEGKWRVLKKPTKPGVRSYDTVCYTVEETAKFRTAARAGNMVAGKINKRGTPSQTFGITGGNWKCDDARVYWNGTYWLAHLTWTHSADSSGWDSDLYD